MILKVTNPKQSDQVLEKKLNDLEEKVRQLQAKEMGMPNLADGLNVPPEMLELDDVLEIARQGGQVESYPCFAKVDGSTDCVWDGPDGPQTWDEFFAGSYPYIVPAEANGMKYFGLHSRGKHLDARELLSLQNSGVTLLSAEQYKTETAPKEEVLP